VHWEAAFDPEFWFSVMLALLCSGLIGFERQLRGKPAGVRTSALVCLGTFLYVYLSEQVDPQHSDPTRVLGQVVTGVGFLGAGLILSRDGVTKGVTSAAVIWVLAAIGGAIGLKQAGAAVAIAGVTLLVLTGVRIVEVTWQKLRGVLEDPGDD
jgi:putative Mg2+ transporter-C (MgtC) family protein